MFVDYKCSMCVAVHVCNDCGFIGLLLLPQCPALLRELFYRGVYFCIPTGLEMEILRYL